MSRPVVIAIDGPVASGKTSVGKLLAKELHYRFLDTGIMYRALTWLAQEQGIQMEDDDALGRLARQTKMSLDEQDEGAVLIDGRRLSAELRQSEVDRAVSLVARVPDVRTALVEGQREIARSGGIVVVGRDVGTVVLPDAGLKVYLMASVAVRARRRYDELVRQGQEVKYDAVMKELEARDELDTGRATSPLRPAADAFLLDTDGKSQRDVADQMLQLMAKK